MLAIGESVENANLRKVEYLATDEMQTAIVTVIRDHIGTNESETFRSAARHRLQEQRKPRRGL